jgi:hypothetical protein
MLAGLTAAIDRQLASVIRRRARRKSLILRLLPVRWLEPLVVAPRVRQVRIKLIVAALGFSFLLAAATLYLSARA